MCCQAVGIVKNQENVKFLLQFPQGKEVSPSPEGAKPGTTKEWKTLCSLRNWGKFVGVAHGCGKISKGSSPGQLEEDEHPRRVMGRFLQFRQKVYFFLQWQGCDSGNHAGQTLCALLESLRWRFTLG